MKIGLHFLLSCADDQSPVARYRDTLDQAVEAEALGFESVWPVEHHFDARLSALSCPTLLLAAIAARTRTLRLGTGIVQLPLGHPLRIAEEVATLDVLSGGRVELGVGRGSNPLHYAGFGVPLEESRTRMEEGLALIERLLTDETVSFRGAHYQVDDVRLAPRPVRPPTVHVAANSLETAAFTGALGHPILLAAHVLTFAKLRDVIAHYRAARARHGHGAPAPTDVSVLMPLYVAEDAAQLEREVAPSVAHIMGVLADASERLLARCTVPSERDKLVGLLSTLRATTCAKVNGTQGIFDTPRGCVARLVQLREELGIGRVIGWFNFGGQVAHAHVLESMRLFAREVLPHLPD